MDRFCRCNHRLLSVTEPLDCEGYIKNCFLAGVYKNFLNFLYHLSLIMQIEKKKNGNESNTTRFNVI